MTIFIYFLVFIFGAIIGSFLNVVILRYGTGESIVYSGSRCFSCGKKLGWSEIIPIFSFLLQKGRCRKCGSKISWQYPIVEAITGLIFTLIVYKIFSFPVIYYWIIFSLLIIISVYDFRHQIIPNGLVYIFNIFAFLNLFGNSDFLLKLLGGVVFFGFFSLLWLISGGKWMGFGDAKLSLGIGWLLGLYNGLIAILFSFWIGAIFGVFLLIFVKKKFILKSRIPFGPFLVLGAIIAFLYGNNILQIYLNIL